MSEGLCSLKSCCKALLQQTKEQGIPFTTLKARDHGILESSLIAEKQVS